MDFQLGCNYWPRKSAMFMWRDEFFKIDNIAEDFDTIREYLGESALVRIFLLWEDFQPRPDTISASALEKLVMVADLALEKKLKLDVTFPCIHMSGPNWIPSFALLPLSSSSSSLSKEEMEQASEGSNPHNLQIIVKSSSSCATSSASSSSATSSFSSSSSSSSSCSSSSLVDVLNPCDFKYRNPFHDELMLKAQCLLAQKVAETLKNHKAVALFNLANEPDLVAYPRCEQDALSWAKMLCDVIRKEDDVLKRPVTVGLHTDSIRSSRTNLPVGSMFKKGCSSFCSSSSSSSSPLLSIVMHAYPQYCSFLREKEALNTNYVAFACALTSVLVEQEKEEGEKEDHSSLPPLCLMEEFGGCTSPPGAPSQTWRWLSKSITDPETGAAQERVQFMASEEEYCEYVKEVLRKLVLTGASGAVMWCFADYSSDLWTLPPCSESYHERFFGLVRPDGTAKPHCVALKEFAATKPKVRSAANKEFLHKMFNLLRENVRVSEKKNEESLTKTKTEERRDWVAQSADETGNNDGAVEKVFRKFEQLLKEF